MPRPLQASKSKEYMFDSGSHLGHEQLHYLESMLDPVTTSCLESVGVRPGMRCLDLGAGAGSITRWLTEHVGPTGTVVAVDLDTDLLDDLPGTEVYRHDINDGLPTQGPFDLIHARLLLLHLSRRREILRTLIDALAPAGWLVIGEFSARPNRVLSAPGEDERELFERVQDIAHNVVSRARGVSWEWAHEVEGHMAEAGLLNIHGLEYSQTAAGGTTGCLLHRNYAVQARSLLLDAGLTEIELKRYHELMDDHRFRAWFYQFICTRGAKPATR